jgi:predicted ATPase
LAAYHPADHKSLFLQFGADPGAGCLDWGSWAYLFLGYPDRARALNDEGVRLVAALGHPWTAAVFLVHVALLDYLRGDPIAALEHARASVALCDQTGMPDRKAEAQIFEGWALAESGEFEQGIELINRGREFWGFAGAKIADPLLLSVLATALLRAGRLADARAAVEQGLAQIERTGERAWEADLHRLDGEVSLAMNGSDTAKDALELLAPVYNWFTEGFDRADLQEARALLEELPASSN